MFGSQYFNHPEILMDSFGEMSHDHGSKHRVKQSNVIILLEKIYLFIFGVPEIGFQIRGRYFKYLLRKMNSSPNKILDAGSGIGAYSFWLSKQYPESSINGLDIDKNKLKFTKKFAKAKGIKNIHFTFGDVTSLVEKNEYDLIVNVDVLEHIDKYTKVLKNFYKALSPNGYLFIHTPQAKQKRIFKSLKKWHHEGHIHEGFSPNTLRKELRKIGFHIVEVRETFGFFGKLSWELNHIMLTKGFVLLGLFYPLLYILSLLDSLIVVKKGLGTAILAKK
jgi:SAM-dependent methyltransferase